MRKKQTILKEDKLKFTFPETFLFHVPIINKSIMFVIDYFYILLQFQLDIIIESLHTTSFVCHFFLN